MQPPAVTITLKAALYECDQAAAVLEKSGQRWENRIDVLARLRKVADAGGASYPEFLDFLLRLKDPLVAQIKDLRSSVVKEVGVTLAAIAKSFQDNAFRIGNPKLSPTYGGLILVFIDTLLAQTCVTIKVISESADNCLRNIVISVAPQGIAKIITKLCGRCSDKSGNIRLKCVEYIHLALINWTSLHKAGAWTKDSRRTQEIRSLLSQVLYDPDETVRKTARECYWSFHACSAEAAEDFIKTVDDANRRRIIDARIEVNLPPPLEEVFPIEADVDETIPPVCDVEKSETPVISKAVRVQYEPEDIPENSKRRIAGPQRVASRSISQPVSQRLGGAVRIEQQVKKAEEKKVTEEEVVYRRPPLLETSSVIHEAEGSTLSVDQLIETLSTSSLWSERAGAASMLLKLHNESPSTFTASVGHKMVPVICERASDLHSKVTQIVLTCVVEFIPVYSKEFGEHLKVLFPALFTGLSNSKSAIAASCNEALNLCMNQYSPDALCAVLSIIVRQKGDKVRLGCVELYEQLVPRSASYFAEPYHILELFKRLEGCLTALNVKLRNAAIKLLVAVSRLDEKLFQEQLHSNELSKHIKALVSKSMEEKLRKNRTASAISSSAVSLSTCVSKEPVVLSTCASKEPVALSPIATKEPIGLSNEPAFPAEDFSSYASIPTTTSPSSTDYPLTVTIDRNCDKDQIDVYITHLLNKLSLGSPNTKVKCFSDMNILIDKFIKVDWDRWCQQLIMACVSKFTDDDILVKRKSFVFVGVLAKFQPELFSQSVEMVMGQLIESIRQLKVASKDLSNGIRDIPSVVGDVESSLDSIIDNVDPLKCFNVLLHLVGTENGEALCESLKLLPRLLTRMPSNILYDNLRVLVPVLVTVSTCFYLNLKFLTQKQNRLF